MPTSAARIEAGTRLCLQEQSPLFNQLSPEIRQMIYINVIAGHVLHIMRESSGLRHVCCSKSRFDSSTDLFQDCYRRRVGTNTNLQLLNLPRTFRGVHAEKIDLLYEGNTFGTTRIPDFLSLTSTPTPQRHNTIRKIAVAG